MSKSLIPAQRRERIQEYLSLHRIARSIDLSQLLDASEATIRRDLEWLDDAGMIERTHGGALLKQRLDSEAEYRHRAQLHAEEKKWIGEVAVSLVEEGDIIFINSGTTTTQIIHHMHSTANLTIITNNMIAALDLGDVRWELILLGGTFQPKSNSVAGRFAMANLSQIYANKAFIGVDGIDPKYGCTVPSNAESEIVRMMIERTHGEVIVCADHSKWGVISNFEVSQINRIHKLITDSHLDGTAQVSLRELGIEILLADQIAKEREGMNHGVPFQEIRQENNSAFLRH
jgi:DeoR family fructose operon transcriptional repressor